MRSSLAAVCACMLVAAQVAHSRNLLAIFVDDLRASLSPYGASMPMPNVDKLAATGTVFQRGYVQQTVCSPSRNSFMSGRYPDRTGIMSFKESFRNATGNPKGIPPASEWDSWPQWFKKNGFLTLGLGKTFHPGSPPNWDEPNSWSQKVPGTDEPALPYFPFDADEASCPKGTKVDDNGHLCPQSGPLSQFFDYRLANETIHYLKWAKEQQDKSEGDDMGFAIFTGFRRPHIPWHVPQSFFDKFEPHSGAIPMPDQGARTIGEGISPINYVTCGFDVPQEYNGTKHFFGPYRECSKELTLGLRQGYYAAVNFVDAMIGMVLDELDALGLANDTAVTFIGDHGWKLAEHGGWSKQSLWETDARIPFIIRAPWIQESVGKRTMAFAEAVDLYKTTADLLGLPMPPPEQGVQGDSLVPVLKDPGNKAGVKDAAFTQFPRCWSGPLSNASAPWLEHKFACMGEEEGDFRAVGYTVRVDDYRYTEWRNYTAGVPGGAPAHADWSPAGLLTAELYDHTEDPSWGEDPFNKFEYVNLASEASLQDVRKELAQRLHTKFTSDE